MVLFWSIMKASLERYRWNPLYVNVVKKGAVSHSFLACFIFWIRVHASKSLWSCFFSLWLKVPVARLVKQWWTQWCSLFASLCLIKQALYYHLHSNVLMRLYSNGASSVHIWTPWSSMIKCPGSFCQRCIYRRACELATGVSLGSALPDLHRN